MTKFYRIKIPLFISPLGWLKHIQRKEFPIIILLFVGSIRFINMDCGEIQGWDEGMYATRAKAILRFGVWFDQSAYSVGGYYSGAHPPLQVWLTALTYKVFGINNFSTRLWACLFGVGIVIGTFLIGREVYNSLAGFIAAILIATNPTLTSFTRLGQLDSICLFFLVFSFFFFLRYSKSHQIKYAVFSGISFGCCLMSKIIVGLFIPIVIFVFLLLEFCFSKSSARTIIVGLFWVLLLGFTVALPWHLYMVAIHGNEFINGFFGFHIFQRAFSGVEANTKELGLLYYSNQLIVRFPFSVFIVFPIFNIIVNFPKNKWRIQPTSLLNAFIFVWFFVILAVSTFVRTKNLNYSLPMLVPIAIIAGNVLAKIFYGEYPKKQIIFIIFTFLLGLLWGMFDNVRLSMRGKSAVPNEFLSKIGINYSEHTIFLFLLGFGLILLIALWKTNLIEVFAKRIFVPLILLVSMLIHVFSLVFIDEQKYIDGAKQIAKLLNDNNYRQLFYICIDYNSFGYNGQLAYYLDGVNAGWRNEGKIYQQIGRKELSNIRKRVALINPRKTFIIIERSPNDKTYLKETLASVEEILQSKFTKYMITKTYIVYGEKK